MKYFSLLLVLIGIILFGVSYFFVINTYVELGSLMLSGYGISILINEKNSPNSKILKDDELFDIIKFIGFVFYAAALLLLLKPIFYLFLNPKPGEYSKYIGSDHLGPLHNVICSSILLFFASYVFRNFNLRINRNFKIHFHLIGGLTVILYYGCLMVPIFLIWYLFWNVPTSVFFNERIVIMISKNFFMTFLILNVGKYYVYTLYDINKKIE